MVSIAVNLVAGVSRLLVAVEHSLILALAGHIMLTGTLVLEALEGGLAVLALAPSSACVGVRAAQASDWSVLRPGLSSSTACLVLRAEAPGAQRPRLERVY